MDLNVYQDKAMETCMPSCDNFSYMMLNLMGELGEFASKVGKAIRKEEMFIGINAPNRLALHDNMDVQMLDELKAEAGDILWQLSGLCKVMGWRLEDVAQCNLAKLASRAQRGVIDGSGDNR